MKRILLLSILSLAACEGGGSEIGPVAPVLPKQFFSGVVLAADGSPIVGASVSLQGQNASAASDRHGRFRLNNTPQGAQTLVVDGRTGAARGVGEAFPRIRIPVTVSGSTPLSFPVVLPNLADAAGQAEQKTVAIGSTLGGSDDITVAGAGLTLTLNGAQIDWTTPSDHPGETQVTISVAILPSDQCPMEMESNGGVLSPALVCWIDPPDITFTGPASISYTSGFFPNGFSSASIYGYSLSGETWLFSSAASVAGGVITAAVSDPGFLSLASLCGGSTILTGRALDADGNPLAGALVTAPQGRSMTTGSDGVFSMSQICATDGNGSPIAGTVALTASSRQMPIARAYASTSFVPGGTTDLGDLALRTQPAGEVHFLLLRQGVVVPNREVSIGAHLLGFGARGKSDDDGVVDFFNVPFQPGKTFQAITTFADTTKSPIAVDAGGYFFSPSQLFSANLYTGPAGTFTANNFGGSVFVTVLREDSDAPIENAFVMIGNDPATSNKGWTNASGQIQLSAPSSPTVTVGVQTTAAAGGGGFDLVRKTAFCSVKAVNASSVVLRLPVAQRLDALTAPWDPFGRVAGSASQLTNPTVTAPVNASGTYAVDIHASPAGDARQLFPVMNERSEYDRLTPAGSDPSAGYSSGGALDAAYTIDAPAKKAILVGVERDSTSASSGLITRFAVGSPLAVTPGETVSGSIAFDQAIGAGSMSISVPGLESALSPPQARLGIETPAGLGVLLGEADAQIGSFTASTGSGTLSLSALVGGSLGGALRVRLFGESNAGGILRRQDAFLRIPGVTASGTFLAVPEFSTPAPLGSFDPTGLGVVWTSSAGAHLHRVRLTRSNTVVESGLTIRDDFDWRAYTPSADTSFVFPVLPTSSVSGKTVPLYFASGETHTIEIRALSASLFSYGPYFVNMTRVRLSDLEPQSESIYQSSATIP